MDYTFLADTILFRGIAPKEIKSMLHCLQATVKTYPRGANIYNAGDTATFMGLVLSGGVSIESDDIWGNRSILDHVAPGQMFAENYACVPGEPLMVNVVAIEQTEILAMHAEKLFTVCSNVCGSHSKLIRNLLSISAQKGLNLSRRIMHTSSKTIRGRLLSYLSFQARKNGSREFDIPFNRQQLANYLSVDRSAMSAELSRMQRDGLLQVRRSHFVLCSSGSDPE